MLVNETLFDPDYIVNDTPRRSELAVPIFCNGEVLGVIDSEHSMKGFFKERHLRMFQVIATLCEVKITEQKARNSIREAEKMKEEADRYKELDELKNRFITNISHDLKTPLSLIKAPASQILHQSKDERIKSLAGYIARHTDHLLRVVDQLLQLNRVDHGMNDPYIEKVSLVSLSTKIQSLYNHLAESKNIVFEVHSENLFITTDSFRLEQILHNLLQNAFR